MVTQIRKALNQIPILPQNIQKLVQIVNSPVADFADITAIVEEDPALSLKTLHLCNSAYYSLPVEVTSVKHAVRFLGFEFVAGLAMAAYFQGMFPRNAKKQHNLWVKGIKKHLLVTARLSDLISRETGRRVSPATAFTSGFLHDSGKLLLSTLPSEPAGSIQDLIDTHHMKLHEAEKKILGVDHAEVGKFLAEHWNLPEILTDVIQNHHMPHHSDYEVTLYVYLADQIDGNGYHQEKETSGLFAANEDLNIINEIGLTDDQLVNLVNIGAEIRKPQSSYVSDAKRFPIK